MPHYFLGKFVVVLFTVHVYSYKFNSKKPTSLSNYVQSIYQNQKRTTDDQSIFPKNDLHRNAFTNEVSASRNRIKKSIAGTENNEKGFVIVIDANKPNATSKFSKRDQVIDTKNSSSNHDDDIQKDLYDQLKTRFEKIEQHLASFTSQPSKEEPQVRVIVITPKAFNISDEKNINLADLENTAAFSKDNLFVKEISSKEYDDTFANSLRKTEAGQQGAVNSVRSDETDHESKEVNDLESMSPLLADKDTLNEVVREINLLRNYSRNDNSSGIEDGEKSQAATILDDVMVMAKGDAEHRDNHEIGYQPANQVKESNMNVKNIDEQKTSISNEHKATEEQSARKETSFGLQVDNSSSTNVHNVSPLREDDTSHAKKTPQLPLSNPEPKPTSVNQPHHHEVANEPEPTTKKHTEDEKKSTKFIKKDNKSPVEQIAKELEKTTATKRNNSREENVAQKMTGDQKDKINPDLIQRKVVDKQKAEAIIEFLNKDPLEVWRYAFKNLHALDLNSTLLRSGLVNAGNIERLKGVMRRALEGKSVTISIVGGSISAGGGLYKDEKSIAGLYYKGLIDWWQKMITPLTGSDMIVNNVAIGSIGTDYFSYCVKNHIANESDIVLWELSANDYNRYKMQPTKGARPLERFTRMVLELPNKPALLYINFFKGADFKATRGSCPDFEDQGEDIIAHYYKIPSLSWRAMVCNGLVNKLPGYSMDTLFSQDEYHPSIRGHAQMSLLILLHLRHVMRAVLQWAIVHDGFIDRFEDHYAIPDPLFMGPRYPEPLCWSLISPDLNQKLTNSLFVRVKTNDGFKLEYATNFPIRFDKVVCWKAEKPHAEIALQFYIPEDYGPTGLKRDRSEVAITTHTRWGGSSTIWIDQKVDRTIVIKEGREHDPGKRTQVDSLLSDIGPGYHILHVRSHEGGFCLSAIMVDSS